VTSAVPHSTQPQLLRAIGRWSMVALAVNSIIGSGIFGLPSLLAAQLGSLSPLAVLIAGGGMALIITCYAELASQFEETGGTYLYLRTAFGRLTGLFIGWMILLGRLTACAAAVNLFVIYLGGFWPQATQPLPRLTLITLFVASLTGANYRGVGAGTLVSNAATVGKLVPLGIVCVVGLGYLTAHAPLATPAVGGVGAWLDALLLLLFSYGGYESALIPMGEARNPRRDAPFALFAALIIVSVLYTLLQLIVTAVLPDAAHSQRPLADLARILMGPPGAALISVGALVSVYGYLSANMLTVPRATFALAERGDFPAWLALVHPRFRTPYVSILLIALLLWGFAQFASFSWNVTLSAVARVLYYAGACVAVPVLRRTHPEFSRWRLPGGVLLPLLGAAYCVLLLTRVDFSKSVVLLTTAAVAVLNWIAVKDRHGRSVQA